MKVARIVKQRHAATAYDGKGASLAGGRWNPQGAFMVYTSENISLALLENLVHLQSASALAIEHAYIAAEVPDDAVMTVEAFDRNYHRKPPEQVGLDWLQSGLSIGLIVPSQVVPLEHNLLLNPQHPDFPRVVLSPAVPQPFDPRLKSLDDDTPAP